MLTDGSSTPRFPMMERAIRWADSSADQLCPSATTYPDRLPKLSSRVPLREEQPPRHARHHRQHQGVADARGDPRSRAQAYMRTY